MVDDQDAGENNDKRDNDAPDSAAFTHATNRGQCHGSTRKRLGAVLPAEALLAELYGFVSKGLCAAFETSRR